jgi:hypothetical protein
LNTLNKQLNIDDQKGVTWREWVALKKNTFMKLNDQQSEVSYLHKCTRD